MLTVGTNPFCARTACTLTMPIRPQVPASLRYYLRARLRPFTRPAFWASLSVLSLIGLFLWEAWQHPEWLFKNPENENPIADTTLSKEDSAVAADIDSLPVLMQELDEADVSLAALKLNQQPQTQNFRDDFLNKQAAEAATIYDNAQQAKQPPAVPLTVYDPLGIETQAPSNPGSLYGGGVSPMGNQTPAQTSGFGASNLAGSTVQTPTAKQVSPLQAALDRLGNNSPTTSAQTQTQINTPGTNTNSLGQPTQPTAPLPGQVTQPITPGYSALPGQVVQPASAYSGTSNYSNMPGQVVQPGSPYPGYPGYGVAPTTSNPVNSYTYLNQTAPVPGVPPVQPVAPQVAPITQGNYAVPVYQNPVPVNPVPNNFGATQVQPSQLQPSPFSVPRPIPGRYIGGGQINTFSNP
jgi:hypothetical protein